MHIQTPITKSSQGCMET